MVIYEIQKKTDKKPYIGYSTRFNSNEEFQKSDYWGSGTYITPAVKEHGAEAFEKKVLLKNIFDKKELIRYERLMIKKRKSHISQGGYNLTWGGDGAEIGVPKTKTHKDNLSKSSIGKHDYLKNLHKEEWWRKNQSEKMAGQLNSNAKEYIFISPEGNRFKVKGQFRDFCKKNNLGFDSMRKVLNGQQKKGEHKGWTVLHFSINTSIDHQEEN